MNRFASWVHEIEEIIIAGLLAAMTLVTFSQVIARYIFNSGATWALELTVTLFAWLVLFGISHVVKINAHLGVDAFVNLFPGKIQRAFTLLAILGCLFYAVILLMGSHEYWQKMWKLGLELEDIPFPHWIQSLFGLYEDGEFHYENIPRYMSYAILPLGLTLLIFRLLQSGYLVLIGERKLIIASHEVEDMLEELDTEQLKTEQGAK